MYNTDTHRTMIANTEHFPAGIEEQLETAYENRLAAAENYSAEEVEEVSELKRSLFPDNFEIDSDTYERLRVLCNLSYCGVPKPHAIRSHRKILGPFIVAVKRLVWRFTRAQLQANFDEIQEFCSWMVHSHAKQIHTTELLKRRLDNIE